MTILFIRLLSCPLFDSFVTNHLVKERFFNWNLFANALRGKVEKHSWQIQVSLSFLVDNYYFMNILSTKLLSFHKYMSKKYFWDLYLYDTELHKQIEKYFRDLCNHFRTIWANILLKIENTFEISSIISWLFEQKYIQWLTEKAQLFYTFALFTFRGSFFVKYRVYHAYLRLLSLPIFVAVFFLPNSWHCRLLNGICTPNWRFCLNVFHIYTLLYFF